MPSVTARGDLILRPVFRAILENATRICGTKIGILFRFDDGAYIAVATLCVTPAYQEYLDRGAVRPGPGTGLGRLAAAKQTVHIIDTRAEPPTPTASLSASRQPTLAARVVFSMCRCSRRAN